MDQAEFIRARRLKDSQRIMVWEGANPPHSSPMFVRVSGVSPPQNIAATSMSPNRPITTEYLLGASPEDWERYVREGPVRVSLQRVDWDLVAAPMGAPPIVPVGCLRPATPEELLTGEINNASESEETRGQVEALRTGREDRSDSPGESSGRRRTSLA